jgi:hypothetical protein
MKKKTQKRSQKKTVKKSVAKKNEKKAVKSIIHIDTDGKTTSVNISGRARDLINALAEVIINDQRFEFSVCMAIALAARHKK